MVVVFLVPLYLVKIVSNFGLNTYLVSPMRNNRHPLLCYCNMFDMSEMFSTSLLNASQQ